MKITRTTIWVAALGMIVSTALMAQQARQPADALEVAEVAMPSQDSPELATFVVANKSSRPVLAWGVEITWTFADGSTSTSHYMIDYLPTVPQAVKDGKEAKLPRYSRIGELGNGGRAETQIAILSKSTAAGPQLAVSAALTPDFVVFSDNSVLGSDALARLTFSRWKAWRDEYTDYLPIAKAVRASSNPVPMLQDALKDVKRARAGENVFGRPADRFIQIQYSDLGSQLEDTERCLSQNAVEGCMSQFIDTLETYQKLYAAHAERAPVPQTVTQ